LARLTGSCAGACATKKARESTARDSGNQIKSEIRISKSETNDEANQCQ
jgi:hypothetical protein